MERTEPNIESHDNPTARVAEDSGFAVVVVDRNGGLSSENNNSICTHLYSSDEFAPRCAEFCGRAFAMATEQGGAVNYECHAGLECRAVPVSGERKLVAIVGRAFTKAENFRRATERANGGDWQQFPADEFFENILINGSSADLEKTAARVAALGDAIVGSGDTSTPSETLPEETPETAPEATPAELPTAIAEDEVADAPVVDELTRRIEEFNRESTPQVADNEAVSNEFARKHAEELEEIAAWRSLFGSLFDRTYREACESIIGFLSQRYALTSLAWLERRENRFESIMACGTLEGQQFKINIPADDKLLFDALENELALELRERAKNGEENTPQTISLFPVSVGGEVQCALVVADELRDDEQKRQISRFCKTVASELEILRLREEVKRRNWLANAVEKFNASLKNLDTDDFWINLTRVSAELMRAERGSLLVFDEKSDALTVKAAVGVTADRIKSETKRVGERVAKLVLQNGRPIVVGDISKIGLPAAPADYNYKTNSFISYPFTIGSRRVGVLNVTDKADGESYGEADLELLNAIAPQVAVLIDRATLKSQAGEFETLSVTDMLTGLLNRRYLEERLAEEIKRSNRYGYPMSFLMIDVDHFKSYNDNFGHAEGDRALTIVGRCLRETLRSADIAARYGGEEFSILLPQTTLAEAETIADRLRENIAMTDFPNRQITISVGIASCSLELNSTRELIIAADRALYEAKRRGRNNVQVYERLDDTVADDDLDPSGNYE